MIQQEKEHKLGQAKNPLNLEIACNVKQHEATD